MKYPVLAEIPSSVDVVETFRGYNHNLKIADGEFYDMQNLSSAYFPIMSPRHARGTYVSSANPHGMIAKDTLCYVDGSCFVMDQYRIDMDLSDGQKDLISMGAYVIIMPDKKYINTSDITDRGSIEASVTTTSSVSFDLCKADGSAMNIKYRQDSEPSDAANMDLWIDTSGSPHVLKQFSESSGMWISIATTYIKISSTGIGTNFSKFDGVTISGLKDATLIESTTSQTIEDAAINAIDGSFVIWDKGDDYIVITGILDFSRTLSNSVTVSRKMPNMDFLIESENRLWGCRYGTAENGSIVNEIYASKLGDFKNWNCFMGISTDSYVASCGTDGQFTGAITHLGYPLFFKEGCLHKVYGNYPSNFSIQTTACRGVQKGSSNSLAIVNEVLYYKSRNGICVYDGSLPSEISSCFGEEPYFHAVAGSHGNKYYVSMEDSNGKPHFFVYDSVKGTWHKEDNTKATEFCSCRNEMYFIEGDSIRTVFGSGTKETGKVKWMAETGILGTGRSTSRSVSTIPGKKYISQLQIRMSLEIGSAVHFYIQYDSSGQWEHVCAMEGHNLRSFYVPIRPKRCDHFRIKIEGEGEAKIYSIAKTIEKGSDL